MLLVALLYLLEGLEEEESELDANFEMENPDADANPDATEDEAFETAGQFSQEFLPFLAARGFSRQRGNYF